MVITFFLLIKDDLKSADLVKILKPQCDRSRLFFFFIKLSLNPILSGWDKVSHFRHTQGPLFQGTYPTVVYLGQSHHPWNGAKRGKYIQFSGLQYAEEPARFSSYGTLFLWPYWDAGRYDPTRFESFRPVTTRSKKGPPPRRTRTFGPGVARLQSSFSTDCEERKERLAYKRRIGTLKKNLACWKN